jgi:hypothetical protein
MSSTSARFQLNLDKAKVGTQDPEIGKVQRYLTRFGYLTETIEPETLDAPTAQALRTFQRVMGIEETGELDGPTTTALEQPRCGTPDVGVIDRMAGGEVATFVLRGCSYAKTTLTYRFVSGTGDIAGAAEQAAVRNAFATWASALCGVRFEERASGTVDFEIGWFSGNHGDGSNFDGVGNVLAHAFYPPPCGGAHAGELHFDEAETWSLSGNAGTFDTETVALHEIGHLLGLDHSAVAGAVMAPSYGGVRRALTQDDVDGVRRLYPFLCRRGDSGGQAGFVSEIATARHGQHQLVTAVRTQAGTLKLIAWNVASGGAIGRTGDSGNQAGAATSIALARNGNTSRFVTACRTGSGRLRLIAWDVNASGSAITRLGDSGDAAGAATLIRIVSTGNNRFVTACRDSDGDLKLIGWRLHDNGSLTRLADSGNQAGDVSDIDLVDLPGNRVLTAVRSGGGSLLLISWSVGDGAVTRLGDSADQAGAATMIRAVVDQAGHVVTAVRAGDGSLKLITWTVAANGTISRLGDSGSQAGVTEGHSISTAAGRVVTPVRTDAGHLKVIVWQTGANGTVSRIGDSANLAGSATLPTSCEALTGAPPIVTSVRTSTNSLKLISWSMP